MLPVIFKMAEVDRNSPGAGNAAGDNVSPQKRKWESESAEASTTKRISTGKESQDLGAVKKTTFSMNIGKPLSKTGNDVASGKPVAKSGISMNISGVKKAGTAPIKLSLGSTTKEPPAVKAAASKVASVFSTEDSDSEEEMPPEAKMRMRNVGRDTPTAAGPNSFGKGNMGFCDRTKMIERELKRQMEEYCDNADST